MNKDRLTGVLGALGFTLIGSFILLFNAVSLGQSRAGRWLSARGSASPEEYAVIVDQSITVFIVLGGVLFAATLFGGILFFSHYLQGVEARPSEQIASAKE